MVDKGGAGSLRRTLREREWWLLAAAVVLFFGRQLTTGTFFFRDLYQLIFPKRLELLDALRNRQLPLWDPLSHGGQPFLADPSHSTFYPSNLLYAFLKPITSFNVALVLQFLLAAFAAYLLARTLRLTTSAAFVAGVVYALSGFALSCANLMPLALALPWVPLTLALVHRLLCGERGVLPLIAAASAAMPLIGGSAEGMAMTLMLVVAWSWSQRRDRAPGSARVVLLVIAAAIGLSLVQTLPATELIANSSRSSKRSYESFSSWSVNVRRMPELLVPRFFGGTDSLNESDFWGGPFETQNFPYVLSLYFGVPTVFLAVFGGLYRDRIPLFDATARDNEETAIRGQTQLFRRTLLGMVLFAIVISLGRALPGFRFVHLLPIVAVFRYPVKILFLSLAPMALLAGFGFDRLRVGPSRALLIAYSLSAGTVGAVALWMGLDPAFSDRVTAFLFQHPLEPLFRGRLIASLWHVTVAAGAAAMALYLGRTRNPHLMKAHVTGQLGETKALIGTESAAVAEAGPASVASRAGLAVVILLDLAAAGTGVNAVAPRHLFDLPPVVAVVREIIGPGRFHRVPETAPLRLRVESNDLFWLARRNLETLSSYSATAFGIPVIFHADYDGLAPSAVASLSAIVDTLPWPRRAAIFEAGGIRAFIAPGVVRAPGVTEVGSLPDRANASLHLYAMTGVQPIRFTSVVKWAPTPAAVLARMITGDFQASDVILTGSGQTSVSACHERTLRVVRRDRNTTELDIDTPCGGYVYFAETFYPGWKIDVDGREQPMLRANYAFSAAAVSAGHHVLRKSYAPRLPLFGALGTLATALALAGWTVIQGRTSGRSGASPS